MVNEILEAISTKLGQLYPDYHIYFENPKQNMKEPCFILSQVSTVQRERLGYKRVTLDETYSVVFLCHDTTLLREIISSAGVYLRFLEAKEGPVVTNNRSIQLIDGSSAILTFEIIRTVEVKTPKPPLMLKMIMRRKENDRRKDKQHKIHKRSSYRFKCPD